MITIRKSTWVVGTTIKFLLLLSMLTYQNFIWGQQTGIKVTTAKGKIAVINAGDNRGISSGLKYILKRGMPSGIIEVGVVRVEKTLPDKSGIRLIEERGFDFIQEGDFLGNQVDDSLDELFGNDYQREEKIVSEASAQARRIPSQPSTSKSSNSRLGLQCGIFSSSVDNFDKIYGSSSGFTFGVEGQWLFSDQFGTSSRFRYFSKKGKPLTFAYGGGTITDQTADWTEYWFILGVKGRFPTSSSAVPFFGAGLSYFSVKESISGTFSYDGIQEPISASISKNAWGLALFGGVNINLSNSVFLVLDGEFTTASIQGEGGIGGSDLKVGGLYISAGIEFAF